MAESGFELQIKLLENNLKRKKKKLSESLIQDDKFIKLKREVIYLEERIKYMNFKNSKQLL